MRTDLGTQLTEYGRLMRAERVPVSLPEVLSADSAGEVSGSSEGITRDEGDLIVIDIQTRPTDTDPSTRRWLPYLLAVAAAVALVVGAVALFGGTDNASDVDVTDAPTESTEQSPAPDPTEQTEGATAEDSPAEDVAQPETELIPLGDDFVDAYYSGDPESVLSLGSTEAALDPILYYQAYNASLGFVVTGHECTAGASSGADDFVSCDVTFTDELGTLLGYTLIDRFMLIVADGTITDATVVSVGAERIFGEFTDWMWANGYEPTTGACQGLANGLGETPAECGQHYMDAARAYVDSGEVNGS